ncbi:PHD finger protein 11 [Candoia aspera]|uniref:PHD finger protein 11 n=1 Tax=Candoia aspera TaxID=51853 RepID=UPI002FD7CE65
MVRRHCALCQDDEAAAIMYIAEEQNLAVHQDCLLFSSAFAESEEHDPENLDKRFDVASVAREIKRGKRLMEKALSNGQIIPMNLSVPKYLSPENQQKIDTSKTNHSLPFFKELFAMAVEFSNKVAESRRSRIEFLKKCKQAGLLDEIFEKMLDALHLAQEKLMDGNTSEAEYEETVISLFGCGLFKNILAAVHSGTEEKIQELMNTQKRLDAQIELLKDLKEIVLPVSEDTTSTSNSVSE